MLLCKMSPNAVPLMYVELAAALEVACVLFTSLHSALPLVLLFTTSTTSSSFVLTCAARQIMAALRIWFLLKDSYQVNTRYAQYENNTCIGAFAITISFAWQYSY